MRVLLTGGTGQLGRAVQALAPDGWDLLAPPRARLPLSKAEAIRAYLERERPTHILHAGAWTAVDAAESSPEEAHAVNAESTDVLAAYAAEHHAKMLYISTDFVFGPGHDRPIPIDATPAPQSVYGATKLAGERAVRERLGDEGLIVRTSWVWDRTGTNFVNTMLRLMRERHTLNVVCDQIGSPTYAPDLAAFCALLLKQNHTGTWHFSNAGVASWYDFACAIHTYGHQQNLLPHNVTIRPIPTEAYPTPATRPRYSVLCKQKTWEVVEARHWGEALVT